MKTGRWLRTLLLRVGGIDLVYSRRAAMFQLKESEGAIGLACPRSVNPAVPVMRGLIAGPLAAIFAGWLVCALILDAPADGRWRGGKTIAGNKAAPVRFTGAFL